MTFLKKIHGDLIFSSILLKRGSSQKKLTWIWCSLYYLQRCYFLSRKHDIISLDGKWKMIFLKKYMEILSFVYTCVNVTNMVLPFCQKKIKDNFLSKNTLKGHWHSRKSLNDFLYFYGDVYRGFYILHFNEKKKSLKYRIETGLLLQFIWLEICYNELSSILCTSQPSGVVFKGVLVCQSRKLFVH